MQSISIPTIEDPNCAVLACRSGSVDWLSDVDAPYRAEMLAQKAAFYAEHATQVRELQSQGLDEIEIDRRLPADPRNLIIATPAFGTSLPTVRQWERFFSVILLMPRFTTIIKDGVDIAPYLEALQAGQWDQLHRLGGQ